ncbi:MAG: CsbD family protein [Terriglobia bacterium]
MNQDQLEGKWKQLKGSVKERWGKLTDDDMNLIGGRKDKLVGKLQERYGIAREEAETQYDAWYSAHSLPEVEHHAGRH